MTEVALRAVSPADLETIFRPMSDPESVRMAAFDGPQWPGAGVADGRHAVHDV
ncbi:hypothetical protein [Asanoa sp. NPDC050611]|uniref:hypothetical protein n=1 Tax=Asanoa sp. NPDC050611 TaxID=3157098 RepID=UPI0033C280C1